MEKRFEQKEEKSQEHKTLKYIKTIQLGESRGDHSDKWEARKEGEQ